MASEGIKQLLIDGLSAVQGAGKVGSEAAAKIGPHATHPELKAELQHGSEIAETWRQRLEAASKAAGSGSDAAGDNEVIQAIYKVGQTIIQRAQDDTARDAGIIATGQLALHYYIAAFGTLQAYAKDVGMSEVAGLMEQCLVEAKQEDARHTELAGKVMGRH